MQTSVKVIVVYTFLQLDLVHHGSESFLHEVES